MATASNNTGGGGSPTRGKPGYKAAAKKARKFQAKTGAKFATKSGRILTRAEQKASLAKRSAAKEKRAKATGAQHVKALAWKTGEGLRPGGTSHSGPKKPTLAGAKASGSALVGAKRVPGSLPAPQRAGWPGATASASKSAPVASGRASVGARKNTLTNTRASGTASVGAKKKSLAKSRASGRASVGASRNYGLPQAQR